ncbi:hypothetical protein TELCIR_08495 [Teladorsagia circumcincta]|uniref:Uncharacterized protein n=1 Tax=Teladorsagia circumcincta TaxID=45464 RepID=A0A2G9UHG5_TELCI|nr:hypothetical protein TELCIR_08495 [Teladorsagia circumcincta]
MQKFLFETVLDHDVERVEMVSSVEAQARFLDGGRPRMMSVFKYVAFMLHWGNSMDVEVLGPRDYNFNPVGINSGQVQSRFGYAEHLIATLLAMTAQTGPQGEGEVAACEPFGCERGVKSRMEFGQGQPMLPLFRVRLKLVPDTSRIMEWYAH